MICGKCETRFSQTRVSHSTKLHRNSTLVKLSFTLNLILRKSIFFFFFFGGENQVGYLTIVFVSCIKYVEYHFFFWGNIKTSTRSFGSQQKKSTYTVRS